MGRKRQREVTGYTYEQRVERAKNNKLKGIISFVRKVFRLKPAPIYYANNNRKGIPARNWKLKEDPDISIIHLRE